MSQSAPPPAPFVDLDPAASGDPPIEAFRFGDFRLDLEPLFLKQEGRPVDVALRALIVLQTLLARTGELVTKDQLLREAWPEAVVTESSLTEAIHILRTVLDDSAREPRWIETVRGRGYRFRGICEVVRRPADREPGGRVAPAPLHTWPAALLLLSGLSLLAFGGGLRWAGARAPQPPLRFEEPLPPNTKIVLRDQSLALAPDGSRAILSLIGDDGPHLWSRQRARPGWTPLPGTDGARSPTFEPSRGSLLYLRNGWVERAGPGAEGTRVLAAPQSRELAAGREGALAVIREPDEALLYSEPPYRRWRVLARPRGEAGEVALVDPRFVGEKLRVIRWRGSIDESFAVEIEPASGAESRIGSELPLGGLRVADRWVWSEAGRLLTSGPDRGCARALDESMFVDQRHLATNFAATGEDLVSLSLPLPIEVRIFATSDPHEMPADDEILHRGAYVNVESSPSGDLLALIRQESGSRDLWTFEVATGRLRRRTRGEMVTSVRVVDDGSAWVATADGRLSFLSLVADRRQDIVWLPGIEAGAGSPERGRVIVAVPEGSAGFRLADFRRRPGGWSRAPLHVACGGHQRAPTSSPGGERLAFLCDGAVHFLNWSDDGAEPPVVRPAVDLDGEVVYFGWSSHETLWLILDSEEIVEVTWVDDPPRLRVERKQPSRWWMALFPRGDGSYVAPMLAAAAGPTLRWQTGWRQADATELCASGEVRGALGPWSAHGPRALRPIYFGGPVDPGAQS